MATMLVLVNVTHVAAVAKFRPFVVAALLLLLPPSFPLYVFVAGSIASAPEKLAVALVPTCVHARGHWPINMLRIPRKLQAVKTAEVAAHN